ncbi:MAG: hypothetical protein BECKG1743F_GA0114225_100291 [Candidatus Kentron sp. G]|nr:MAG: hypothetical protein BECKG1743F_GA0114225_100291 [Candidatus Kentron sp. G]
MWGALFLPPSHLAEATIGAPPLRREFPNSFLDSRRLSDYGDRSEKVRNRGHFSQIRGPIDKSDRADGTPGSGRRAARSPDIPCNRTPAPRRPRRFLGDCRRRIYADCATPDCATNLSKNPCSDSRRNDGRIASYVTVIATQKLGKRTSKLVYSSIEIALGDWQKRIYRIAQDFRSDSRRNNRRIVHYVTVIATPKLDDKDKQVGIFFDRNRLNWRGRSPWQPRLPAAPHFDRFRQSKRGITASLPPFHRPRSDPSLSRHCSFLRRYRIRFRP